MAPTRRWWLPLLLLLACGGPREPGARPGETVYWRVVSSEVEFGACTDDPLFRDDLKPIEFSENSYFIYRYSDDGKRAVSMSCESFSPSSCQPLDPEVAFEVAGNELLLQREQKSELGDGGCQLQTSQSWLAEDKGVTMDLSVGNAMSLVDAPADCDRIEKQVKADSPNGLGFQGCVVTYKLGFSQD